MIYVAAAIILSDDRILIARRGPNKDLSGYWEFPGGKIEPEEDATACLTREILEELSLHIKVSKHLIDNVFDYPDKTIYLSSFICHLASGTCTLTDHDQVAWILPEDLDRYKFCPADLPVVDALKAYLTSPTEH